MAEVDTLYLSREHSDIRREGAEHTNEIVKEGLKGDFNTRGDIKDARYDLADRVGNSADRIADRLSEYDAKVADRFFVVGRDTADLRAQVVAQQQQIAAGFAGVAKDTEIASLKGIIEGQKNTTYLSDKISSDGDKTRAMLTANNDAMLNRMLIERNSDLCCCRQAHGRAVDGWSQAQWQGLANQMAAFQSQLQETRQGMVNFGTMAGVGQSSTSNNVR